MPVQAQRGDRVIVNPYATTALEGGGVVSKKPRPLYLLEIDPVPVAQMLGGSRKISTSPEPFSPKESVH
jgi:hypothetical protein